MPGKAALLLLVSQVVAAAPPPAVRVWADTRACRMGHPIAITFRVAVAVGQTLDWQLTNAAFEQPAVALLAATSQPLPGGGQQHRVVFTATEAGRRRLGPFRVVMRTAAGPGDTLLAPALEVHFGAESPRTGLHPLRDIRPVWAGGADAWPWRTVGGGLLLGAAVVSLGWLVGRKKTSPPSVGVATEQARQVALRALTALEQANGAGTCPNPHVPEQLFAILTTYFQHFPALTDMSDPAPESAPRHMGSEADLATRAAVFVELNQARFAPYPTVADGLLAKTRQLLTDPAEAPTQTAAQV